MWHQDQKKTTRPWPVTMLIDKLHSNSCVSQKTPDLVAKLYMVAGKLGAAPPLTHVTDGGEEIAFLEFLLLCIRLFPTGPVAQWIRRRPTEPGIVGSSPTGVIVSTHFWWRMTSRKEAIMLVIKERNWERQNEDERLCGFVGIHWLSMLWRKCISTGCLV